MTRKTVREALAVLFVANGSFTGGVNAYPPVDLQGMDKVLAIYSMETSHQQESSALELNFYTFALTVFVKRAGGETVEDTLDDLHEVIRSVVKANQSNANWDLLDLGLGSEAGVDEVSGVAYRLEVHKLLVKEMT
jgi:hypothetical protein